MLSPSSAPSFVAFCRWMKTPTQGWSWQPTVPHWRTKATCPILNPWHFPLSDVLRECPLSERWFVRDEWFTFFLFFCFWFVFFWLDFLLFSFLFFVVVVVLWGLFCLFLLYSFLRVRYTRRYVEVLYEHLINSHFFSLSTIINPTNTLFFLYLLSFISLLCVQASPQWKI